jgi:YcxB-like protein
MNREISINYTPQMVKTALRRFWFRTIGWPTFLSVCAVLAAFVYFLIARDDSWVYGHWGPNWFLVFMIVLGLVLFLCVVFVTMCLQHLNQALRELAKRNSPIVVWKFTDDHISTTSELVTAEMSWKLVEKIWQFPEVWLLFFSKNNFMTLPLDSIDYELGQFITAKVMENGGRVS